MLEIEYEFREQDLVHFNEVQFLKNEEIQQNLRKNRWIVPGIMGLIGAFYYFYYHDMNTSIYILIIAFIWAMVSPKVMLLDLHRQILKNYTEREKVNMFGTYTLTIDPSQAQYLLEKSPSGKHKMSWSELVRVEYGKRYVYIFITLDTALVIPVETVKKGNLEQFAEQAEKMIERYS
ncbi:MAG: YcxB family protein [Methylococcaceae bacterium]